MRPSLSFHLLSLLVLFYHAGAVDRSKFKTCSQAAFCKRNRFLQDEGKTAPGYRILPESVVVDEATLKVYGKLENVKYSSQKPLPVTISLLNNATVRVQVTEDSPLFPRWEAATPSADVLVPETIQAMSGVTITKGSDSVKANFGGEGWGEVEVFYEPFRVTARLQGKPVMSLNDLGLMNFEAYRPKEAVSGKDQCASSLYMFDGPHNSKYLSGCPAGGCSTFASLREGLEACSGINDCGGVVMRPENGDLPFELRKETDLKDSPSKEQSYVKSCMKDCKHVAFTDLESATDSSLVGSCLEERCKKYPSLAAAQMLCINLNRCTGVVMTTDNQFELRKQMAADESTSSYEKAYTKVCTEKAPTRKVVAVKISGHNGIHSFRMGLYRSVMPSAAAAGGEDQPDRRLSYKHESENYFLYYSTEDDAWALGPTPGDSNVWVYTKNKAQSPDAIDSVWSYFDGDSEDWIEDSGFTIDEEEVEIVGDPSDATTRPAAIEPKTADSIYPPAEEGMWEESFGGHTDPKPRGPAAVAMDVTYDGASTIYGLAEHASSMALQNTVKGGKYSDPYRLYNLDVFEYELDETMALYGAIPLITAHSDRGSVSSFWLNSAETFIDVADGSRGKVAHWISESGTIDLFVMLGENPKAVAKEYALLTGFQALPQEFSLGYHQCRWNYKDEADVKQVDAGFDTHDIPYDTLWLDIEHTDGKKYFTWDKSLFPNPVQMQEGLKAKGRKMVTIIDPHIKRDNGYHVHKDAEAQGLYVKDGSGSKPYEGWCWPGSVSYLDFFNPNTLQYWADKFSFDQYEGSTDILYTWNDMNEPSVFNGPEVTMKKQALHYGDVEHRDVHNLYGMQVAKGTWHGQAKRLSKRPFVLTRSFFAGSQRFGAMWTGDNKAEWGHLRDSVPMLLSMGICGFPFAGADVGGFFGDPNRELLLRWYQVGAFYPFFRGHGHIDTKRREPWLFGEPWTSLIREAIRTRYRLLPYVYSLFHEASTEGVPVMRPLYFEFPSDKTVAAKDDEFMFGDSVLVKPVVEEGATTASVYFPEGQWYDWQTFHKFEGPRTATVKAPLEKIPIYFRGGRIIPTKERARRNSLVMKKDPYTLYVILDAGKTASGSIYLDDGESMNSKLKRVEFSFAKMVLSAQTIQDTGFETANVIERIVVVGLGSMEQLSAMSAVSVTGNQETDLGLVVSGANRDVLIVRKPEVPIAGGWKIKFN